MAVSRAGGKLEAAIERFGLAAVIAGARAIDVGASTGGFTQALLAHGARQRARGRRRATASCIRRCAPTRA